MWSSGSVPSTRRTVSSSIVRSESSGTRCFGVATRLSGQNRSPLPPAMMQA